MIGVDKEKTLKSKAKGIKIWAWRSWGFRKLQVKRVYQGKGERFCHGGSSTKEEERWGLSWQKRMAA